MPQHILRRRVVVAARGWIGTRFHHQGRLKATPAHHGGVDCLGLLAGVARELNLCVSKDQAPLPLYRFDRTDYTLTPDGLSLRARLAELLGEIPAEAVQPGDIALFRFDGNPQHLAIISDYEAGGLGLIHAYAPARRVVEHRFDAAWQAQLVTVFSIAPALEEPRAAGL